MKIVAIANQKGGVGKTTTAVNLGAALAEIGHRILIIDLDPQANATSSFGLQAVEQTSLYEPLLGGASITERIFPTEREALFIVPSDLDLAGAEVEIARMPNHLTRLAETLQHFRERVYQPLIRRSVRLSEAPSFGKSILEYAPAGAAAEAYRALAREFIQRHSPPAITPETTQTQSSESRET